MKIVTAAFLLAITAVAAHAELPAASATTVNQSLNSGKPTVIDLGARRCIPCKKMAPILESLSNEYRGKANVLFIDVHDDQAAAQKFGVQMIPTQIFFNTQGKEVKRHIGFLDKPEIVKELNAAGTK